MKVLVTAITCEPGAGSEGGVGWSFVQQIAEEHDVYVLAGGRGRTEWARARGEGRLPENISVRFVDDPAPHHRNRLIARLGTWRDYLRWTRLVPEAAREWHREVGFDLVHQLTYATWRVPPRVWSLGLPFVWGPIGGVARVPLRFYGETLSPSAVAFEILREASSFMAKRSRRLRQCLENASVVIAANEETRAFLLPLRGARPMPVISIAGYTPEKIGEFDALGRVPPPDGRLRLFAGGNMIGSKGLLIALKALKRAKDAGIPFHYTIAGGGPDEGKARALTGKLGLGDQVTFHPGFKGNDYLRQLLSSDVYLLPSFRETTPGTLIEAMLGGAVPVVADASAPGEIVDASCGYTVPIDQPESLIGGLCAALADLHGNRSVLAEKSLRSASKAREVFTLESRRRLLREAYSTAMGRGTRETPGRPPE